VALLAKFRFEKGYNFGQITEKSNGLQLEIILHLVLNFQFDLLVSRDEKRALTSVLV